MKIKDYIKYQRCFIYEGIEYDDIEKDYIKFAVNIDVDHWEDVLAELSKTIPEKLLYCSQFDMLKYLGQQIKGVTIPQIYLKVILFIFDSNDKQNRFLDAGQVVMKKI